MSNTGSFWESLEITLPYVKEEQSATGVPSLTSKDIFSAVVKNGLLPVDGGDATLLEYCGNDPQRQARHLGLDLDK